MIHFATVHYLSDRWIDIQLREIDRYTDGNYKVWGCLNEIDERWNARFHKTFDLQGKHGEKLNELSREIYKEASDEDLLVFIDGDAFPIAEWVGPIRGHLADYPLAAVRRNENLGDIQPHPCFAVTTVGFWKEFDGDWEWGGKPWINAAGYERQDAGGRVLTKLEEQSIPWSPLLRSNRRELHPVLFGVYADLVYHHGSGFREVGTTVDKHLSGALPYMVGRYKWKRGPKSFLARQRMNKRMKQNAVMAEEVFAEIARDVDYVKRFFLTADDGAASVR